MVCNYNDLETLCAEHEQKTIIPLQLRQRVIIMNLPTILSDIRIAAASEHMTALHELALLPAPLVSHGYF